MGKVQNHTEVFQQKIELRQRRVGELREIGLKIDQIQERLAEEGQFWSIRTIKDDLKSRTAEERRDELERAQSADISRCDDVKVRLEFRDRKIERLTPRQSPEVQVNVANQIQVEKNITVTQLLEHYQQFIADSDKASPVRGDDTRQQVHQAQANTEAEAIPVK